ncbi:MAG: thioredoxin family protein [Chloroflexota bacterium]|nr:thioredoxin family protein [Chloroflexota bacterium]
MAVTAERFNQGLTYDEYKAQMTRNRDRFEANEQRAEIDPADLAAFKNLPQPLNVLVLAEDWCGDVISNLPVLGRLAAESGGKLNVRVFLRDQNLDIMDQYLKDGQFRSIPVFVFFDDEFNEIGRMLERPESVTQELGRRRQELYTQNPDFGTPGAPPDQLPEDVRVRLMGAMGQMREEMRPFIDREVVREVRAIVEGAPAAARA